LIWRTLTNTEQFRKEAISVSGLLFAHMRFAKERFWKSTKATVFYRLN